MITKENVYLFSQHYKDCLDGEKKKLAKSFVINDCIDWDKERKCYVCRLTFGQYFIKWDKETKKFECLCGVDDCAHVLALFMQLKIWHDERNEP